MCNKLLTTSYIPSMTKEYLLVALSRIVRLYVKARFKIHVNLMDPEFQPPKSLIKERYVTSVEKANKAIVNAF